MNVFLLHVMVFASIGAIILSVNVFLASMICLRRIRRARSEQIHQQLGAVARFYGKSLLPGRTAPALDFSAFYEAR